MEKSQEPRREPHVEPTDTQQVLRTPRERAVSLINSAGQIQYLSAEE